MSQGNPFPKRSLNKEAIVACDHPIRVSGTGTATHPGGGQAVTDWYIDIAVHRGYYKVENLGDFADAVQQRLLSEQQMMQALRGLETACEGLHRSAFEVPELLSLWDIKNLYLFLK
jgi:predicted RNA-binding protein associated with RNAse of E/G family